MDGTGNIRKGPDSECYIKDFFESLDRDCKTKINSFFKKGKSEKLYGFIKSTINEWDDTRFGYGFPAMQSEGWLLQVVVGTLVKWCVAQTLARELQTLEEEPEIITIDEKKLNSLGSRYTSRYMVWDKHSENIILCIDTKLSSLGKKMKPAQHLPPRKPDVTLLIDNKISLFLETKMGYGEGGKAIESQYRGLVDDLRRFSVPDVISGLVAVMETTKRLQGKLAKLKLVNNDEEMKELMNKVDQAVKARFSTSGDHNRASHS